MSLTLTSLQDPALLCDLNNAGMPWVNFLEPNKAAWLIEHAALALLAVLDGQPAGVIVVLPEDAALESEYLDWFKQRYTNFLYIDRVAVADWARGRGVARALYDAVNACAGERGLTVVSELYSDPLNVPSLKLHTAAGFVEVGRQFCSTDGKWVMKLVREAQYGAGVTDGRHGRRFMRSEP